MALRNWDCLPLKSPRSKSGKAFAGFRQTSSILAIYLQRRLSLFTLCSCRQRVKARPARGQIIEMDGVCWHIQQVPIMPMIVSKALHRAVHSRGNKPPVPNIVCAPPTRQAKRHNNSKWSPCKMQNAGNRQVTGISSCNRNSIKHS